MKTGKKIIELLFAFLVLIHSVSCTSTKTNIISSLDKTCFVYYDDEEEEWEILILLSLYKVQNDTYLYTLNPGYSSFNGCIFVRDGDVKYSGGLFNEYGYVHGWPRIIIPELGINKQIENGFFHEIIPSGTYDVILIADSYYSIHFRFTFQDRHYCCIDFYLGRTRQI